MSGSIYDRVVLNNGVQMPWLGLGVWGMKNGDEVESAIKTALNASYRSIDTAASYGNEKEIGQTLKESGVPREEIFVTTKASAPLSYESTLESFEESRRNLGLEYIDLYLLHWPFKRMYNEMWRALEKIYKGGYVRAIGVCNFLTHHLEDLLKNNTITPAVNQVEFHPLLSQNDLHSFCKNIGIQLEAWGPLMKGIP